MRAGDGPRAPPLKTLHVTPIEGLEQIKTASVILRDIARLPPSGGRGGAGGRHLPPGRGGPADARDRKGPVALPLHRGHGLSGRVRQRRPAAHGRGELPRAALARAHAEDEGKPLRKSHENPDLLRLYETWLGEAGGPLAHELLHTRYVPRAYERVP